MYQKTLIAELGFEVGRDTAPQNHLTRIDHLIHNLRECGIEKYKKFYGKLFGFESVWLFNIEGKKTGLYSEVMISVCSGIIRRLVIQPLEALQGPELRKDQL